MVKSFGWVLKSQGNVLVECRKDGRKFYQKTDSPPMKHPQKIQEGSIQKKLTLVESRDRTVHKIFRFPFHNSKGKYYGGIWIRPLQVKTNKMVNNK